MHTLFIMQFNISQTEPFFNMNQGTPESTGRYIYTQCVIACVNQLCAGGFSFMQMTLNEDESSSTSIQDFFSQFGKTTDTSSHSETAGTATVNVSMHNSYVYMCTDYGLFPIGKFLF